MIWPWRRNQEPREEASQWTQGMCFPNLERTDLFIGVAKHEACLNGLEKALDQFVILSPEAVSEAGSPSAEARRYIKRDHHSGRVPRVHRNAMVLAVPLHGMNLMDCALASGNISAGSRSGTPTPQTGGRSAAVGIPCATPQTSDSLQQGLDTCKLLFLGRLHAVARLVEGCRGALDIKGFRNG